MEFQEQSDDTLVVAKKNTKSAKEYLRFIEEESGYHNVRLNRDKCVRIAFNSNNAITFADGQPLKSVDETIYIFKNSNQQTGGSQKRKSIGVFHK